MHYFSPYAALEESVAEPSYNNLHKIITKPFSASIENINIFKLPHEPLNAVSLRNFKMKPRGMWLIFLVMYELQSMDLIFKTPTVCKINNLPQKTKQVNKLPNHNIQLLLY